MTHAAKISRAQTVAVPRPSAVPAEVTEWIVAAVAVAVLFTGLVL